MIESSNGQSVDIVGADLVNKDTDEDDLYSKIPPEEIIFSFGKGWTSSKGIEIYLSVIYLTK